MAATHRPSGGALVPPSPVHKAGKSLQGGTSAVGKGSRSSGGISGSDGGGGGGLGSGFD